jgi:hypothetical protein
VALSRTDIEAMLAEIDNVDDRIAAMEDGPNDAKGGENQRLSLHGPCAPSTGRTR